MRPAAIVFDLDGTLVDSVGGIAHALNAALAGEGLPGFDLDTVRAWIGDGPDALIARALASPALAGHDGPGRAARLRQGFDAASLAAPMAGSAVFAGLCEVLDVLGEQFPLAVVTNKPTVLSRAVLDAAGLLPRFAAVHGADALAHRKPSPHLLREAAGALGVAPARLLMVGDAPVDIAAANAAGAKAAWAGWGYGAAPPDAAADVWRLARPGDLLERLALPTRAGA